MNQDVMDVEFAFKAFFFSHTLLSLAISSNSILVGSKVNLRVPGIPPGK